MAPSQNGNGINDGLPQWLDNITLEKAIKEQIGDFKKILEIKTENGTQAGESYSSLMMRIKAEVEIEGQF